MSDFSNRSLKKSVDGLTEPDKELLLEHTCSIPGCGSEFEFTIGKGALEQDDNRLKKYSGRCGKCGKSMILAHSKFQRWEKLIRGSKLIVVGNTYDDFFGND